MTLDDYLSTQKLTAQAFAELIDRDKGTISLLRRGLTKPDADTVTRIFKATSGKVTANDFFHGEETAA